jgi:K+-sensing histidine kinase KdpD
MAVFQKFRQVAGDDHHRPGGARLGLLFSRQGVAYFGGRMWLRLTSERGAYFGFLMPHRTAPQRMPGQQQQHASEPRQPEGR